MELAIHIIIVVLATAFFLWQYVKNRYLYQLLFVIWIPSTLLKYISSNQTFLMVLGILQLILFFFVIFAVFRFRTKRMNALYEKLSQTTVNPMDKEQGSAPDSPAGDGAEPEEHLS